MTGEERNYFSVAEPVADDHLLLTATHVSSLTVTAHLYCQRQTWIWIQNPMATLYYAEHVHIEQTRTRIPISVKVRNPES